ncbi:hypothetical protein CDV50_12705 [Haematobacter massiliensis]|uniref:Uncharacterized protein n=1 Tax=Haematobacter massiliensis TaxID=195105 RepID=A0A086Y7W0_9RHOB|nr:DUF3572 domain-containing protein [Haematobacter massiliensis]KFI30360.1 hypothetical protein CN97_12285 [Haematobacter massiliensis]OWJ70494.1 hypothetical protein CDV50_12705 [Haematobacter massiliensis]OWJ87366.1 hypothetical protein CDV51_06410 [Haematobacter massiliensis]QBJ24818.1 DUF3572 family protein [Haematobacter massiliensis]
MQNERESAETLAIAALGWLAADEERWQRYLVATGASAESVAQSAREPELLASVMDFLLTEDQLVLGFAAEADVRPEAILRARRLLPGGETLDWA